MKEKTNLHNYFTNSRRKKKHWLMRHIYKLFPFSHKYFLTINNRQQYFGKGAMLNFLSTIRTAFSKTRKRKYFPVWRKPLFKPYRSFSVLLFQVITGFLINRRNRIASWQYETNSTGNLCNINFNIDFRLALHVAGSDGRILRFNVR